MRRTPSFLAATALAASALLVPAAARADAIGVKVTTGFDVLDPARVATFEVAATSATGVTGVRANVHYWSPGAEPYAALEFTRAEGTDNAGVWRAELRPDVQSRPGPNYVEVLVTTADGATVRKMTSFDDCYRTTIDDFTSSPAVIDIDHSDVALSGRVMVQKSRDTAPEPVAGVRVVGPATNPEATTDQDGRYVQRFTGTPRPGSYVQRQGQLCAVSASANPTVNLQAMEITAQVTPSAPMTAQGDVVVKGKVVRHGAAGTVPVAGVPVWVEVPSDLLYFDPPGAVSTGPDGTFQITFKAGWTVGKSGKLTVHTSDSSGFLTEGKAELGPFTIGNATRITDFTAGRHPLPYGDPIEASGRLTLLPNSNGITNLPVDLEFSRDGKKWSLFQRELQYPGTFFFSPNKLPKEDGYWRARYAGSTLTGPAVSDAVYVDIKYRTQIYNFNASPEPVKKGKTITVKGLLYRFMDKAGPGPNAPVSIYFKPSGSTKWSQVAVVKTASNGWFSKNFKASKDGTWMASYNGSANYIASNKPSDYVDVR
ncbi:hypothetical protein ABT299_47505 [Spirillospora sp. NPDC000708]